MKYITYAFFLILIFYNIRNKRSKSQKVVVSRSKKCVSSKYTSKIQTPWGFPQYGNSSFQFQNSNIGDDEEDFVGVFQRR